MGGCRCSYKSCRSATKTTENLHFFHYPVKHHERCAIWIQNADKPEFASLPAFQLRNKVVCGLHFEDKYFANVEKKRLVHNAIPTLDMGCEEADSDLSYVKEVEVVPSGDGTTFVLQGQHLMLQPGTSNPLRNNGKNIFENELSNNEDSQDSPEEEVYTIDPSYFDQPLYSSSTENPNELVINAMKVSPASYVKLQSRDSDNDNDDEDDDEADNCMMIYENESANASPQVQLNQMREIDEYDEDAGGCEKSEVKYFDRLNEGRMRKMNNSKDKWDRVLVKQNNSTLLRSLKGRIPDSLLGIVSMHLYRRRQIVSDEERTYATLYRSLPPVARLLLQKHDWYMPLGK